MLWGPAFSSFSKEVYPNKLRPGAGDLILPLVFLILYDMGLRRGSIVTSLQPVLVATHLRWKGEQFHVRLAHIFVILLLERVIEK